MDRQTNQLTNWHIVDPSHNIWTFIKVTIHTVSYSRFFSHRGYVHGMKYPKFISSTIKETQNNVMPWSKDEN